MTWRRGGWEWEVGCNENIDLTLSIFFPFCRIWWRFDNVIVNSNVTSRKGCAHLCYQYRKDLNMAFL